MNLVVVVIQIVEVLLQHVNLFAVILYVIMEKIVLHVIRIVHHVLL